MALKIHMPPSLLSGLRLLFAVVLCLMLLNSSNIFAQQASELAFDVTPKRCVTLRQGQPCFAVIRFNWQSNDNKNVCLVEVGGPSIKCWDTVDKGAHLLSQNLSSTTEYILIDEDGVELQRAKIVVSWVYRTKRSRRRWRLF